MMRFFFLLFIPFLLFSKQKVLHISFHNGCIGEIQQICRAFNLELDTWNVLNLKHKFLNGKTRNQNNYIMTHENADLTFNKHKKTFEKYDLIITSDIAPLSRIFFTE